MAGNFDDIVFPQIALFAVLIIILVWIMSKNLMFTLVAGAAALYLGMSGELESIGIGQKSTVYRCADFLSTDPDLAKVGGNLATYATQLSGEINQ